MPYQGTYDSLTDICRIESSVDENGKHTLALSHTDSALNDTHVFVLYPLGEHVFAVYNDQGTRQANSIFIHTQSDTNTRYFSFGNRLFARH